MSDSHVALWGRDLIVRNFLAVHPWLTSLRDEIIGAMRTAEPGYPDSTEWRLSTSRHEAPEHRIMLPDEWNRPTLFPAGGRPITRESAPELFVGLPPGSGPRIPLSWTQSDDLPPGTILMGPGAWT